MAANIASLCVTIATVLLQVGFVLAGLWLTWIVLRVYSSPCRWRTRTSQQNLEEKHS